MAHLIPIPIIILTVTLLVRAKFHSDWRQEYILKPTSTILVIAVALLSLPMPTAKPVFTLAITLGLVLSLGGDVALMLRSDRWFFVGLVLFLLAQIIYSLAFTLPNGFHTQDLAVAVVLLASGLAIYLYLRPGLGPMKIPVIFYLMAILFMVSRAISAFFGSVFTATQAWLLTLGAVLFTLSDLMLAINRFRRPFKTEPIGLFLYYGGQLLIALSPSYFS